MVVDRGGLNYIIEVKDAFSANIEKFKAQIASANAAMASLKQNLAFVPLSKASQKQALVQAANNKLLASNTKLTADNSKKLLDNSKKITNNAKQQTKHNKVLDQSTKKMNTQAGAANRLSFSFRRLFGILAAFAAARKVVQVFTDMIRGSIAFNKSIERMTLGIASLFTAVAEVRNLQGEQLDSAERLTTAIKASKIELQKLRKDALLTAATFEQLVDTFQVALAPGLRAGLGVDQIRTFALRISQAAEALSIPQRQLSEEIRSILTGVIKPQNTRIAIALGISNEDIRTAKELGTLAEFLTEKFAAFGEAGKIIGKTFSVIVTKTQDAFKIVSGEAFIGLFDELKVSLQEIFDTLVQIDDISGVPLVNPRAVQVLRTMSDQLQQIVELARKTILSLDFDLLESAANALGAALKVLGAAVVGIVQGFILAAALINNIILKINELKGRNLLAIFDVNNIASVAAIITAALVTIKSFALIVVGLRGAFLLLVSPIGQILGALAAVFFLTQKITELLTGENLGLSEMINLIKTTFIPAIKLMWVEMQISFFKTVDAIEKRWKDMIESFRKNLGLIQPADFIPQGVKAQIDDINKNLARINRGDSALDATAKAAENAITKVDKLIETRNTLLAQIAEAAPPVGGDEDSGLINDLTTKIQSLIAGIGPIKVPIDPVMEETNIDAIILRMTRSLADAAGLVHDLNEEIIKSEKAFEDSKDALGLTGSLLQQNKLRIKASNKLYENSKELQVELASLESNKLAISILLKKNEEETLRIQKEQSVATDIEKHQKATKELIGLKNEEVRLSGTLKILNEGELTVKQGLLELENKINQATAERIKIRQQENIRGLGIETQLLEIDLLKIKTAFITRNANQQTKDTVIAAQNLVILEAQKQIAEEQRILTLEAAEGEALRAKSAESGLLAYEQILAIQKEQETQREIENEQIRQANVLLEEQRRKNEKPLTSGALQGLKDFVAEAPTLFEIMSQNITRILQQASQALADTIVEAFDPTTNTSIAEAIGNLLKVIAKQILAQIISLLIAQLVIALFGLNTGAAALSASAVAITISAVALKLASKSLGLAAAALGAATFNPLAVSLGTAAAALHTGGNVGDAQDAFMKARGFSGGGIPNKPSHDRPKGLHPSDTVPIWADPKEWIIRANSVKKYGSDVLSAINQGLIDPMSLRTLATGHRHVSSKRPRLGFAEGGSLSNARTSPSNGRAKQDVVGAVMAANDENANKLLQGGRYGVLQFVRDNQSQMRGALGIA